MPLPRGASLIEQTATQTSEQREGTLGNLPVQLTRLVGRDGALSELAVLELLSPGHTNREIAAALYISPSTAGVHVSNILCASWAPSGAWTPPVATSWGC